MAAACCNWRQARASGICGEESKRRTARGQPGPGSARASRQPASGYVRHTRRDAATRASMHRRDQGQCFEGGEAQGMNDVALGTSRRARGLSPPTRSISSVSSHDRESQKQPGTAGLRAFEELFGLRRALPRSKQRVWAQPGAPRKARRDGSLAGCGIAMTTSASVRRVRR